MNIPSVTSQAAAAAAGSTTSSTSDQFTNPNSTLNQSNFLQLLVAQIQYQDPMNPQSDTQMASQLAQFTSLQQASQSSSSLAMIQANSLVGSSVTIQVDSTHTTSGTVTGVILNNGTPQITVGGANYGLNQVTAIAPVTANATSNTPTTSSN